MTVDDAVRIMDVLSGAYPGAYAKLNAAAIDASIDAWAAAFARDDPRLVAAAVQSFIEMDEKGFPPVPGQIKAKMRLIMQRGERTEAEAWSVVRAAIANSGYSEREEFAKLPEDIQRILGGPEHGPAQLHGWALMDAATVQSVVASNFQRSYREYAAREREYNALPQDVRTLINSGAFPALKGRS